MERLCYSIHNIIKIELRSPPEEIARFFESRLEYLRSPLIEEANLSINFVDRIEPRGVLRYVGDGACYDDEGFYLIDRYSHKVTMPMARLGDGRVGIVAESKIHPTTLYHYIIIPIIRYQLLRQGMGFIHASCLSFRGKGILVAGWSGSGKTNLLLSLLEEGADYMADDHSILSSQGKLYAYPEPLNLYDDNLCQFPEILRQLSLTKRGNLLIRRIFEKSCAFVSPAIPRSSISASILFRLCGLSKELSEVWIAPERLFSTRIRDLCDLDLGLFLTRTPEGKARTIEQDSGTFLEMLIANLDFESLPILRLYLMYRSAFQKRIGFIEEGKEREILSKAIEGKRLYQILIPDVCNWKELSGAIIEGF